jgi:hypothetical protein
MQITVQHSPGALPHGRWMQPGVRIRSTPQPTPCRAARSPDASDRRAGDRAVRLSGPLIVV